MESNCEELEEVTDNVNLNSHPSKLKITDMRVAVVRNWPIIRLDTNQDIYGLGEVRDGASKNYALFFIFCLFGENSCNVYKVFRQIKQF